MKPWLTRLASWSRPITLVAGNLMLLLCGATIWGQSRTVTRIIQVRRREQMMTPRVRMFTAGQMLLRNRPKGWDFQANELSVRMIRSHSESPFMHSY